MDRWTEGHGKVKGVCELENILTFEGGEENLVAGRKEK
jgi:hypothetical protein